MIRTRIAGLTALAAAALLAAMAGPRRPQGRPPRQREVR